MSALLEVASGVLLAAGALFAVIGGVGIVRLPDFYSRLHGGGVTDTLGAGLVLVGLLLRVPALPGDPLLKWLVAFKLLTVMVFLFVTSPTSAHALSKSAMTHGLEPRTAVADEDARP